MSAAIPVKSWYLAEHDKKEKRLPHQLEDSDPVDLEQTCDETGLQIFQTIIGDTAASRKGIRRETQNASAPFRLLAKSEDLTKNRLLFYGLTVQSAMRLSKLHEIENKEISLDETKTCLKTWKFQGFRGVQSFDSDNYERESNFENLKKECGFIRSDVVNINPATFADYHKQGDIWYTEHFHPDEEIRFIINGGGYWDFRDINDRWVRLSIGKNDLIIIPPGMYHRFTTDSQEYCEMMRLFSNTNEWVAHFRPADDHPVRLQYLKSLKKK